MTEQIPISKFNRRLPYVLSFLIPVFIMIGIFAGKEIGPGFYWPNSQELL